MKLVFSSDLLGLVDNQKSSPFGDKKVPLFNELTAQWHLDCPLGECGMTLRTREVNLESQLVFSYSLGTSQEGVKIDGKDIFMGGFGAMMEFECVYKNDVKVSSEEFNVNMADADAKAIKFGSLQDGFSLSLFEDRSMDIAINSQSRIFVGQTIYGSVDWALTSLTNIVNFYIDTCNVQFGDNMTLPIIDNNCYSSAFGVSQLQEGKVVSQKSSFQFTTFTVGEGARSLKMKLSCSIRACSVAENLCDINITKTDLQCPDVVGLSYKAISYLKT